MRGTTWYRLLGLLSLVVALWPQSALAFTDVWVFDPNTNNPKYVGKTGSGVGDPYVYQCSASVGNKVPSSCTIDATTWAIGFSDWATWGFGGYWVYAPSYLAYFGWPYVGLGTPEYSMGPVNFTFKHQTYDAWAPCPPVQATTTYTCGAGGGGAGGGGDCSQYTWYYDADGDGVGVNDPATNVTGVCEPPSGNYSSQAGDECPDYYWLTAKITMCVDQDGDWIPLATEIQACPDEPGVAECYLISEFHGPDCDDTNPLIGGKIWYCTDADADGYCKGKAYGPDYFEHCPNLQAPFVKVWDTKPGDECDTIPQIQKKTLFCIDTDTDGFGDPAVCEAQCFYDPVSANPPGWMPPEKKDCPGGDNDWNVKPTAKWVIDCDGDGYYTDGVVKTGCPPKPQPPAYCATTNHPQQNQPGFVPPAYVIVTSTAGQALQAGDCDDADTFEQPGATWVKDEDSDDWYNPQENVVNCNGPSAPTPGGTYVALASPVGQALQKGDCDDTDPQIREITYEFADQDADGLGDTGVVNVHHCANAPASDPDQPPYNWVAHPDDLTPLGDANPSFMNTFFVTDAYPPFCYYQAQSAPPGAPCAPPGDLCATRYMACSGTSVQNCFLNVPLLCVPQVFRAAYCPALMTLPGEEGGWFLSQSMENHSPYGTFVPMITQAQLAAWHPAPATISYNNPMLLQACLFQEHTFYEGLQGWIDTGAGEMYASLNFDMGEPVEVHFLVKKTGTDYTLDFEFFRNDPLTEHWYLDVQSRPTVAMSQTDLGVYFVQSATANTVSDLLAITGTAQAMPMPIPIRYTTGPKTGTVECVWLGELLPASDCAFRISGAPPSPLSVWDSVQSIFKMMFNTTDTDGDGVRDVAELLMPGLPESLAVQITYDGFATPTQSGWASVYLEYPYALEPADALFWAQGRQRAHDLAELVFARTQEIMQQYVGDQWIPPMQIADWHTLIDTGIPSFLWYAPDYAVASRYTAWSEQFLSLPVLPMQIPAGMTNAQVLLPLDQIRTRINLWEILNRTGPGEAGIAYLADVILHEILHHHIYISDDVDPHGELEHALIFGITGQFIDYGCSR